VAFLFVVLAMNKIIHYAVGSINTGDWKNAHCYFTVQGRYNRAALFGCSASDGACVSAN
jgi:hypothetical protein